MRKILFGLATLGVAAGAAVPASAQYFPQQPYGYGYGQAAYGQGYGYGYGYNPNRQFQSLHQRIEIIQDRISRYQAAGAMTPWQGRSMQQAARNLEVKLRYAAGNGLNPSEARSLDYQVRRMENQLTRYMRWQNNRRYQGYNGYNGYNNGYGYNGYNNGYGYNGYNNGYNGYGYNNDRDDDGD